MGMDSLQRAFKAFGELATDSDVLCIVHCGQLSVATSIVKLAKAQCLSWHSDMTVIYNEADCEKRLEKRYETEADSPSKKRKTSNSWTSLQAVGPQETIAFLAKKPISAIERAAGGPQRVP